MELTKSLWTEQDRGPFLNYLKSLENTDKVAWTRNILNTKLDLLAIQSKTMGQIISQIQKGNYVSFMELKIFDYYETIAIYGKLLSDMDDFSQVKTFLNVYTDVMENWAHCDILSFKINDQNRQQYLDLSETYLHDPRVFVRRLGLWILFMLVKEKKMLPIIFDRLNKLEKENEYYVIMMAGWLLSECIILYKDETLDFIQKTQTLNKKIVNKGIQKCRESRRLTQEEKDALLIYKRR